MEPAENPVQRPAAERLIIADDHPLFRTALEQAVRQVFATANIDMVETFAGLKGALETEADLLLLDLNMPDCRGYAALAYTRSSQPALPVVVVSAFEEPRVVRGALDHGASGFIPKSAPMQTIVAALGAVRAGEVWVPEAAELPDDAEEPAIAARVATLTPQQLRVLVMLTEGMLNKQIAIDLAISEATVKAHITAILRKLGVYTRTQAVIAASSLEIDWQAMARRALAEDTDPPPTAAP